MTPSEVAALLALIAHTSTSAPDASEVNVKAWTHALHDARLVDALHASAGLITDREVPTSAAVLARIEDDLRARVAAANRPDDPDERDRRYRRQFRDSVAGGYIDVPGPRGDDVQTLVDDALGGWCSYCKAAPTEPCTAPDGRGGRITTRLPHPVRTRDRRAARQAEAAAPEIPAPAPDPADDPWSQLEGDPR